MVSRREIYTANALKLDPSGKPLPVHGERFTRGFELN
jgi:hypothetical protein